MFNHFVSVHSSAAKNCKKNTKTLYFAGLRSFKVIDVDVIKNHVPMQCLLW